MHGTGDQQCKQAAHDMQSSLDHITPSITSIAVLLCLQNIDNSKNGLIVFHSITKGRTNTMASPTSPSVRRSPRQIHYDSNGRDYLADKLGCSRMELEEWIQSPTVRPHLRQWYILCVSGPKRFNDAIEWINSGADGYFYNPDDLEEELLFLCLEAVKDPAVDGVLEVEEHDVASLIDEANKAKNMITQELWARTALRIVHSNKGKDQTFEKPLQTQPATCYAFAIDLLCIAFHSIAFRGYASIYEQLINGKTSAQLNFELYGDTMDYEIDEDHDVSSNEDESDRSTMVVDHSSDDDFQGASEDTDAISELSIGIVVSMKLDKNTSSPTSDDKAPLFGELLAGAECDRKEGDCADA
jgi:hypothetical protein